MIEDIVKEIKKAVGQHIKGVTEKNSQRVYIDIDPSKIREVATYLWKDRGARYVIATALDNRTSFEVLQISSSVK